MQFLLDALRGLKRVVTGEVIHRMDSVANHGTTTMSVRLKRDRGDVYYVVLAQLSSGSSHYASFSPEQFRQFAESVSAVRESLDQHVSAAKS